MCSFHPGMLGFKRNRDYKSWCKFNRSFAGHGKTLRHGGKEEAEAFFLKSRAKREIHIASKRRLLAPSRALWIRHSVRDFRKSAANSLAALGEIVFLVVAGA